MSPDETYRLRNGNNRTSLSSVEVSVVRLSKSGHLFQPDECILRKWLIWITTNPQTPSPLTLSPRQFPTLLLHSMSTPTLDSRWQQLLIAQGRMVSTK